MKSRLDRSSHPLLRLVPALLVTCLVGCEKEIEEAIRVQLDRTWSNSTEHARLDSELETSLDRQLEANLIGKETIGYAKSSAYVRDIRLTDVNIGTVPPSVDVQNVTLNVFELDYLGHPDIYHYDLTYDWTLTWAAGNNARVSFVADMTNGHPAATIRVRDLSGIVSGNAWAAGTVSLDPHPSGFPASQETFITQSATPMTIDSGNRFTTAGTRESIRQAVKNDLVEPMTVRLLWESIWNLTQPLP